LHYLPTFLLFTSTNALCSGCVLLCLLVCHRSSDPLCEHLGSRRPAPALVLVLPEHLVGGSLWRPGGGEHGRPSPEPVGTTTEFRKHFERQRRLLLSWAKAEKDSESGRKTARSQDDNLGSIGTAMLSFNSQFLVVFPQRGRRIKPTSNQYGVPAPLPETRWLRQAP